ncbi:amino acid/amide ABC transporter ATP-binding protein 1, HAAT family [Fervidobacterium changbaicum]|uniref:ABC transporter ATP-binding protein n=1 Tax=Fervidobacterium changbaicum TaxID=310769 RepID=A0AAE5XD88_9BACT|nr:ABC transporter ATP-binding protein [Fervidobacterium changbaicum]QAV33979.1 ABC transporter ATP-binding protein [Fervidobacterium changbaicum]SDH25557.1 amino acid/amide ABC transporter ATP-binding protein 1, HAAT family [Fervidobacterium changbaicum]
MLKLENISVRFSGLVAVDNLTMEVKDKTIHSLIGPNGAGKTTVFNAISGLVKHDGRVLLDGKDITHLPVHKRVYHGLGRSFQNIIIFKYMTVLQNLMLGYHSKLQYNHFDEIVYTNRFTLEERKARLRAIEVADLLGIKTILGVYAGTLPYGFQKLIDVGRALMTEPKILLLDEPAAGLTEKESDILKEKIIRIRDNGITVFLIEHDMRMVLDISDRITVINFGKKIAEGTTQDVVNNEEVIKAYLGTAVTVQ